MDDKRKCLQNLSILKNNDLRYDLDTIDYGFESTSEIRNVIQNAFNGQTSNGLDRLSYARNYIMDIREEGNNDIFTYIMNKHDIEDHPETIREAEEEHDEALKALDILINCLEVDEFKRINQFVNPCEYISLKNIVEEKRLPEEMGREVMGFLGKTKITGGIKRKRKTRKTKKRTRRHRHKKATRRSKH